jgi:two-component system nitrate/nitrite response regulator NarL
MLPDVVQVTKQDSVGLLEPGAHTLFVVGRDPLSGDLLSTAIGRNVSYSAVSVSASSLLRAVSSCKPVLVIISADLSTISGEGFALASALSRAHPQLAIVLLLAEASREAVIRAFQSGAIGVFCQDEPISELLQCIEHVANGSIWAGKKATETLLEIFKNIPCSDALTGIDAASLTPRELQVIQCAATGKTNKAIATQLRLSEHTVKNYMFRAFAKLGLSSRVELLFYLALRGHSVGSFGDDHSVALSGQAIDKSDPRAGRNGRVVPNMVLRMSGHSSATDEPS